MDTVSKVTLKGNTSEYEGLSLQHFSKGVEDDINCGINDTIYNYMTNANAEYGKDIAMTYFNKKITYSQLQDKIHKLAKALKYYGIQKGDVVSICLPNVPEVVYFKYALSKIGGVSNMIDPRTNANRILEYVNQSDSKLFVGIIDIFSEKTAQIIDKMKVDNIVTVSPSDTLHKEKGDLKQEFIKSVYFIKKLKLQIYESKFDTPKNILLNEFLNRGLEYEGKIDAEFEEESVATILYTSGTTGDKYKGVLISNEAYNAMSRKLSHAVKKFERNDTFLGCIPFFSAYGSLCGMHNSLVQGWNIILIPRFNPNKFDELIYKYKPNNALGVPRFWESVANSEKLADTDLSFIKYPITGGDKISPSTVKKINDFFIKHNADVKLKIGYGATEFGGAVSVTVEKEGVYDSASAGPLLPGNSAIVVNPETNEIVPVGTVGEICVSGHTMMLGYQKNEDATNSITYISDTGKKYLRSGDRGYISKDGILYIIDRYKRSIMRPDGHTVASAPIENVLLSNSLISNCCVVGIKQIDQSGAIPTAFIILNDSKKNTKSTIMEIDRFCLTHLPERDRALVYVIVEKLPYTLMGKIDFKQLEKLTFDDFKFYIVDEAFFNKTNYKKLN